MKKNGFRNFYSPPRAPIEQVTRLQMNVGHNGVQVVIVFSQAIKNIQMSEEQTEAHIKVLQESLDRLREMKK